MLLTAQKVKEIYGIHRNTLLNWEKRGLLKSIKTPGGKRRYKKEDIEKLLGILEENPRPRVVLHKKAERLPH